MGNLVAKPSPWEIEAEKSRRILADSIPKQWLLTPEQLPPTDRFNVLNVPAESGIMSEKELQITQTDATGLVRKMGAGDLSAEEVTIAFLKRATIGNQLVSQKNIVAYSIDFC